MQEGNGTDVFWTNKRQKLRKYILYFIKLLIKCSFFFCLELWDLKMKSIISVSFQYCSGKIVLLGDVISKTKNFIIKKAGVAVGKM